MNLDKCKRIWAVPSIHAQIGQLQIIHDMIFDRFMPGDRIVYMGNYTGYAPHAVETVNEILSFRRCILSLGGVKPTDIVYLRGAQEEMMQKLVQVQFAPNPRLVIEWMLGNGIAQTLESYGVCVSTLTRTAGEGVVQLAKWTGYLRNMVRRHAGHEIFSGQYRRAAYQSCAHAVAAPSPQQTSSHRPHSALPALSRPAQLSAPATHAARTAMEDGLPVLSHEAAMEAAGRASELYTTQFPPLARYERPAQEQAVSYAAGTPAYAQDQDYGSQSPDGASSPYEAHSYGAHSVTRHGNGNAMGSSGDAGWTSRSSQENGYNGHDTANAHTHAHNTLPPETAAQDHSEAGAFCAPFLFVSAGIDFTKPLEDQGDVLWWGKDNFSQQNRPYLPFQKVFRGFDPLRKGVHLNCVTATLDNNCGFGGRLICAGIDNNGDIFDIYQA